MKNDKNYMGFLKHKIWQNLKHFSRALSWVQPSYFWRVYYLPTWSTSNAKINVFWKKFSSLNIFFKILISVSEIGKLSCEFSYKLHFFSEFIGNILHLIFDTDSLVYNIGYSLVYNIGFRRRWKKPIRSKKSIHHCLFNTTTTTSIIVNMIITILTVFYYWSKEYRIYSLIEDYKIRIDLEVFNTIYNVLYIGQNTISTDTHKETSVKKQLQRQPQPQFIGLAW